MPDRAPVLEIDHLTVSFPREGHAQRLKAVDRVSMTVYPSQTLAVVGESGSGKSVSALTTLRLVPTPPAAIETGVIRFRETPEDSGRDLLRLSDRDMRRIRGNQIAMIFQEPMTSLNPVYTIGDQVLEAILLHQKVSRREAIAIAESSLRDVGIADPSSRLREYPHQLSGGMRQRVMIAMALACQPTLLLADEPTTALDVTIQAQILELLRGLQNTRRMAILLITHDLGVVAENADVVCVMYSGRVLEYANVYDLFNRPLHPYTRGLLGSMPRLGVHSDRLPTVTDAATIPDDFPQGFTVAPHDPEQNPVGGYGGPDAQLYEVEPGHWVLCEPKTGAGAPPRPSPSIPRIDYRRDQDAQQAGAA